MEYSQESDQDFQARVSPEICTDSQLDLTHNKFFHSSLKAHFCQTTHSTRSLFYKRKPQPLIMLSPLPRMHQPSIIIVTTFILFWRQQLKDSCGSAETTLLITCLSLSLKRNNLFKTISRLHKNTWSKLSSFASRSHSLLSQWSPAVVGCFMTLLPSGGPMSASVLRPAAPHAASCRRLWCRAQSLSKEVKISVEFRLEGERETNSVQSKLKTALQKFLI